MITVMPKEELMRDLSVGRGRPRMSWQLDPRVWAFVKGGLLAGSLLAEATGHRDLSLAAQVLAVLGDATMK